MRLTRHESNIAEHTDITVEHKQYAFYVRIRTCGVITYQEKWTRATRARERFERVVESHELGETL